MTRTQPPSQIPTTEATLPPADDPQDDQDLTTSQPPSSSAQNRSSDPQSPPSGPRAGGTGSGSAAGPSIGQRDVRASFRASTTDAAATKQLARMIMGPLGMLLVVIGRLIHARRTPDLRFGRNSVWIPDEAEQRQIGEPLARIIARRVPAIDGSEGEVSDAMDLIQAGVGAVGFAVVQLAEEDALGTVEMSPQPQPEPEQPEPVVDLDDDTIARMAGSGQLSPFDLTMVPGI